MNLSLRIPSAIACTIVGIGCFDNGGGLDLPQWVWSIVGICWLLNAVGVLFSGHRA